jgi:hypothetical protein
MVWLHVRNPQANAMVKQAHQPLGKMPRLQNFNDQEDIDLEDPFLGVLSAVGFAMQATVHTTTRVIPSQLVLNMEEAVPTGLPSTPINHPLYDSN